MPYEYLTREERDAEPVREPSTNSSSQFRVAFRYRCGHRGQYEPATGLTEAQLQEELHGKRRGVCDECLSEKKRLQTLEPSAFEQKVSHLGLRPFTGHDEESNILAAEIRAFHISYLLAQDETLQMEIERLEGLVTKEGAYVQTHPNSTYTRESLRRNRSALRQSRFRSRVVRELVERANRIFDPGWWIGMDDAPATVAHALSDIEPIPDTILAILKQPLESIAPGDSGAPISAESDEPADSLDDAVEPELPGATETSTVEEELGPTDEAIVVSEDDDLSGESEMSEETVETIDPAADEKHSMNGAKAGGDSNAASGAKARAAGDPAVARLAGQTGLTLSGTARIVFSCAHETSHAFDAVPVDTAVRTITALETLICMECQVQRVLQAI